MAHLRGLLQSGLMLIVLYICTIAAAGQTSSLSGSVLDPQGNAVAGATITATNVATGAARSTTSAKEGAYQIAQLAPGTYRVRAEGQGFSSIVLEDVQVLVSTPITLNITFKQVGAVSETVTVQGGESVINTTDATIGNTFDTTKVLSLPLLSRNVVGLLSLQPGVTAPINDTDNPRRGGYVNGARSDQSNVTLDGVDVNEIQGGLAFFSVLRSTPDSLQEFRVTTTNPNSDQGRSSGAQVSLVTRSGSNNWHGALYESHRNDFTAANDWFNNKSEVDRPKLLRNNFGGAVGGPIKKDKAFFFFNYEGFREAKGSPVVREVPLPSLGQGIVRYFTEDGQSNQSGSCPAGTPSGVNCLSRQQISAAYRAANGVDPGTNSAALAVLAAAAGRYPANDTTVGDRLNTGGFRFNASLPVKQNTYIARLDYNLNEKHNLFARANYQSDTEALASQFPDTPSPTTWSQPKGFVVGDAWTISNSLVNNLRYGLTRQAITRGGDSDANFINFRFIYQPFSFTRPLSRVVPVHNITDDLSWTKGSHGMQFGTNIRLISNKRTSFATSFDTASINPSFYDLSGDVLITDADGNPIFQNVGGASDDLRDALASVIGRFTDYGANLNYNKDGSLIPTGTGINRNFKTQEYDLYGQDTWRIRPNLTVTYGVRWSTSTPVYESNGFQVKPVQSLGDFFERRAEGAKAGRPFNDLITIDLGGKANNKDGFYRQDWNNFAPSVAVAWSPNFKNGFLKKIFGENKSTFRGGFRKVFDRLGGALAVSFDGQAILGFSSSSEISANTFTVADAAGLGPLFTGLNQSVRALPLLTINPSLKFPLQHPADEAQRIESGLDDSIITPHNYAFNFSYGRDLGKGFSFEASYVGRVGRNLLVARDAMHLNNLVDPKTGIDFYTAMRPLIALRERNAPITSVQNMPYFQNLFPGLAGTFNVLGQNVALTATQAAYRRIAKSSVGGRNTSDYTFVQLLWDDGLGFGDNLFFHPQYGAFGALSSIGTSDYHAFQTSFRKRFSNNLTFDFNYTMSHSFDSASGLEPSGTTISGAALILNPLDLKSNRASSDFDVRHLINANYIYNLPFGKGQKLLSKLGPVGDFVFGGWQTTGIIRLNTGLPAGDPFDDGRWATNWNVQSFARQIKTLKATPTRTGDPNLFGDPTAAYASYRNAYPGESGDRNLLRDPGYAAFDFGLYKRFPLPWEGKSVVFRWEVFNLTNTQRFTDVIGLGVGQEPFQNPTDVPSDFGRFTSIQGAPRQMQFALRIEF
ncbi:MAG TPA: carboxypeptidase-like regulatory domain-containing protein [Blastocatellia bacterium]|nr:carboxypeptidase-like regulatory domain-containing protein [Blastocatellia bacterium]